MNKRMIQSTQLGTHFQWNSQEIVVYPPNASTTTIHFQCTSAWPNRQPNVCFLEFLLLVSITSTSALSSSTGNSFADERHNPQKPLVFRECENWIETMLHRSTHSRTHYDLPHRIPVCECLYTEKVVFVYCIRCCVRCDKSHPIYTTLATTNNR